MTKLISTTDFVLERAKRTHSFDTWEEGRQRSLTEIYNYANFLKQQLKLEMFVPCDEDGNVLTEPIYNTNHSDECYCKSCEIETKRCSELQEQYRKAKEKVLFDLGEVKIIERQNSYFKIEVSFPDEDYSEIVSILEDETVEDLLTFMVDFDWVLSKNALKQIGL